MSLFESEIDMPEQDEQQLRPSREMSFCVGHEEQEKLFLDLFHNDALPHALIFSGIKGIGKTTMAFRLARFLLKHGKNDDGGLFGEELPQDFTSLDVPSDDPVFSRIASGGHADLLHISRTYNSSTNKRDTHLKVDALRKIEPFLRKTSSEGGWRIVIVEDANLMNRNAQNAILKILEEPPKQVLIILVAHSIGSLIPTIRSRSRVIQFDELAKRDIKLLLSKNSIELSSEDVHIITEISMGSVGQAIDLIENEGLGTLNSILDHLGAKGDKIHSLAHSLFSPSQDKHYRVFCQLMIWIFRYMLFVKAKDGQLPQYLQNDYLQKFFESSDLERLINLSDALQAHFDHVEFSNLDRRDAIRSAFLMIENVDDLS